MNEFEYFKYPAVCLFPINFHLIRLIYVCFDWVSVLFFFKSTQSFTTIYDDNYVHAVHATTMWESFRISDDLIWKSNYDWIHSNEKSLIL